MWRHTSLAKGQWKNIWVADSSFLQRGQEAALIIPRRWSSVPRSKAPCIIDHKKSLSFGAVLIDHTSFSQSKSRLGGGFEVLCCSSTGFVVVAGLYL
ncbi:hypothetical protein Bca101_078600 [Brassica carinata]